MVETGGLENRLALAGYGGSNPSPSAIYFPNRVSFGRVTFLGQLVLNTRSFLRMAAHSLKQKCERYFTFWAQIEAQQGMVKRRRSFPDRPGKSSILNSILTSGLGACLGSRMDL